MPTAAEWVFGIQTPLHRCLMLHTYLLAMLNVCLPLLVLWRLERRARQRFHLQQEQAALAVALAEAERRSGSAARASAAQAEARAGAAQAAMEPVLPELPLSVLLDLYLLGSGVWAAVCAWASMRGYH